MASTAVIASSHQARELAAWIRDHLDGIQIPDLPSVKRVQLAAACWHVAIEHSMAIMVLIDEGLHGSGLALVRPAFESYVRGLWLAHAASDEDLDRAGKDDIPNDFFGRIVADLEQPGRFAPGQLSSMRNTWRSLCSYTHSGYLQMNARLTKEGLGCEYDESDLLYALGASRGVLLLAATSLAGVAGNEPLINAIAEKCSSHLTVQQRA